MSLDSYDVENNLKHQDEFADKNRISTNNYARRPDHQTASPIGHADKKRCWRRS